MKSHNDSVICAKQVSGDFRLLVRRQLNSLHLETVQEGGIVSGTRLRLEGEGNFGSRRSIGRVHRE